jgi:hypothetical protein
MFFSAREQLQNVSGSKISYPAPSALVGINFMHSSIAEQKRD